MLKTSAFNDSISGWWGSGTMCAHWYLEQWHHRWRNGCWVNVYRGWVCTRHAGPHSICWRASWTCTTSSLALRALRTFRDKLFKHTSPCTKQSLFRRASKKWQFWACSPGWPVPLLGSAYAVWVTAGGSREESMQTGVSKEYKALPFLHSTLTTRERQNSKAPFLYHSQTVLLWPASLLFPSIYINNTWYPYYTPRGQRYLRSVQVWSSTVYFSEFGSLQLENTFQVQPCDK